MGSLAVACMSDFRRNRKCPRTWLVNLCDACMGQEMLVQVGKHATSIALSTWGLPKVSLRHAVSNKAWGVSVVVHGDDFTALGKAEGLTKYEDGMAKTFECKLKGRLGRGENDLKEMRVLNHPYSDH